MVDLFVDESFKLEILVFMEYFSLYVSFDVEVVVEGVFFVAVFKVEGELLDVGEPLHQRL